MNKQTKYLSLFNAAIVLFIAAAAFALSFDAIKALAEENGIRPQLSWLVPLIVDGAMLVFSVSVLRASLANEKQAWGWFLIVAFTGMSVVFNIAHSNLTTLGMALAALAPLALLATFETLMSQIKSAMRGRINYLADKWRGRAVILLSLAKQYRQSSSEYHQEVVSLSSKLEKERQQNSDAQQTIGELKAENTKLKRQIGKESIHLDKLPPRLADYVTEVSNGMTPNGDYSERHGIGVTTLERANSMFLNG